MYVLECSSTMDNVLENNDQFHLPLPWNSDNSNCAGGEEWVRIEDSAKMGASAVAGKFKLTLKFELWKYIRSITRL